MCMSSDKGKQSCRGNSLRSFPAKHIPDCTNFLYFPLTCSFRLVQEESRVINQQSTRKPWFLIDAQNVTVQVGERAVLEAQVTGRPLPKFKWYLSLRYYIKEKNGFFFFTMCCCLTAELHRRFSLSRGTSFRVSEVRTITL